MNGHTDEIYTPDYAIKPLLPYLKKEWVIWDCAFGKGHLVGHLNKEGFKYAMGSCDNFLESSMGVGDVDCIVTNPPYSLKEDFLKKAFELGIPFAFLMPLTALEGKKRGELYRKYGIQLIIPNKRINFITPNGGKASWFATAWFCWKLNLPKDLMFIDLERTNSSIPPTVKTVGILEATL